LKYAIKCGVGGEVIDGRGQGTGGGGWDEKGVEKANGEEHPNHHVDGGGGRRRGIETPAHSINNWMKGQ